MPEVFANTLRKLRPGGARTRNASFLRRIRTALAGSLILLGTLSAIRAETTPAPPATPSPAPVHLTDAQDRLSSGQLDPDAEARSHANALYAQAMLLSDDPAGDQRQALELFQQIVSLDPSFTDARIKLANLLLQSGQFDLALAQLQAAAAAHPHSVPIEVALGYTQRLRGQSDEAQRLCTRALTSDPTQSLAMRVLLEISGDQDDLAGGVLHIGDILKAGGPDVPASAWLNLAQLYQEIALGEKSPPSTDAILKTRLPILLQAAAQSPPDAAAFTLLADTYDKLGRDADALKAYRQAIALEPTDVETLLHCAELESDLGKTADEIKDYEAAYALNPVLPGLPEMLGGLYLDNGRFADAARLLEQALATSPASPSLQIDLGIAYEGSHHPEKAQARFQRVFASVDCPPEAYMKLAFFQLDHNEVKQAGETLAAAQAHFPQSARIRFYEAVQHRYEKNYTAALVCLAQVRTLAVGPEAGALDPDYYVESATTLNLTGQKDRLEAVLREGLGKYPDNPELMNELAYFWADQGLHLPEALALSRRAAALEPDNGPILDTWGWVYFQMGQAKDALPYLQRAAFMTNNDPVVLQHVGDAYLKLGLKREAIATWTRALEKDPGNGDLANRIDAAQAQAKNVHLRSAPTP
ncbi:MAG: tetratricopeptide repeat protein [Methylacidiphilales bacterium]|nr:tetratricopeptide repeat protein [Candidatus Methylacidiphilales bacterium]